MPKLYGIHEIAQVCGERRQTVAQWRYREKLPKPDVELAMGPVWRAETIEPWLERYNWIVDSIDLFPGRSSYDVRVTSPWGDRYRIDLSWHVAADHGAIEDKDKLAEFVVSSLQDDRIREAMTRLRDDHEALVRWRSAATELGFRVTDDTGADLIPRGRGRAMPDEVEREFDVLRREAEWLHTELAQVQYLFMEGSEELELINEVAGGFFFFVMHAFLTDLQLRVCRVTDPESQGRGEKNKNLVIDRLIRRLEDDTTPARAADVHRMREELEAASADIRHNRKKQLAHLDYRVSVGAAPRVEPLLDDLRRCIALIGEILNEVSMHYGDGNRLYDETFLPKDAGSLVGWLRRSKRS